MRTGVRFVIKKSKSKEQPFYWQMQSSNRNIYNSSETYTQRGSCKQAIKTIVRHIQNGTFVVEDETKEKKS